MPIQYKYRKFIKERASLNSIQNCFVLGGKGCERFSMRLRARLGNNSCWTNARGMITLAAQHNSVFTISRSGMPKMASDECKRL